MRDAGTRMIEVQLKKHISNFYVIFRRIIGIVWNAEQKHYNIILVAQCKHILTMLLLYLYIRSILSINNSNLLLYCVVLLIVKTQLCAGVWFKVLATNVL